MGQTRGLSRNSFGRRLFWFLRGVIFYGEFRWKHASDSVVRSTQKVERPKGKVENRELIRPRKEPLKVEPIVRRKRDSNIPGQVLSKPEPRRERQEKKEAPVRLVHPESLIPARKDRHSR